ncbi:hypothetical protein [Streptomyces silvisoli]|uniref:Uncharacterized protein n=1 Tax=Streptomyces silvisoli TaxID=3034235 RepID=A0ABT5ZL71_9ACTN|nr:hypothetical protein [Streptomyces silvisoli]MDF3290568.1 hypothetical protein [Streptomyces silvisoli]
MDINATFRLTARAYRSAARNSPVMRATWVISALAAVSGLVSLLSGEPVGWFVYYGLGLPVLFELVFVRLAVRRVLTGEEAKARRRRFPNSSSQRAAPD